MNKTFTENKHFQRLTFVQNKLSIGEYERCRFDSCIFTNADLSGINFGECEFTNCDMSLVKITNSAFREVIFNGCKLLGIHFDECNKFSFSVTFDHCQLKLAAFYTLNLKNTIFTECNLQEVDFSDSNLTAVVFDRCDLSGAIFKNSVLEKVDFRTAYNYSINPEMNRMKKAKFSTMGLAGLLDKYKIEIE